jgi:hypothetical protein
MTLDADQIVFVSRFNRQGNDHVAHIDEDCKHVGETVEQIEFGELQEPKRVCAYCEGTLHGDPDEYQTLTNKLIAADNPEQLIKEGEV